MLCSFIIPAYNASSTIVRCLDSIYKLSLKESDFEVICVDDCSTDNTISIIKDYATSHSNITLLCQSENHRQGAARNRGVDIAKGEYIVFVDSDDESDSGMVEALSLAKEYNLDVVVMNYVYVDEKGKISKKEPIILDGIFSGIELQTKHPYWNSAPWPYVCKKSFLEESNYPFVEDVLYEDSDFVAVHLYYAKRMMYSSNIGYKVHYNATSTTNTISFKHVSDYFLLGTRMLTFYGKLEDKESYFANSILEGGGYNICMSCKRLVKLSSLKDIKDFYKRIDEYIIRKEYTCYSEPAYWWNWWTKLCIKHKHIATVLACMGQLGYKTIKRLSGK